MTNFTRRCPQGRKCDRIPQCGIDCAEPPIVMFDDPLPGPFEVFDNAVTWVRQHCIGIVAACAVAGYSVGFCVKYFF